jgi:hypothetical protein
VSFLCQRCGAAFTLPAYRAAIEGRGTYCSYACRRTRVDRVCAGCGRAFTVDLPRIAAGFGVYCSKRCARMTHGESHDTITPEYRAWVGMRTRCLNPRARNFKDYGGRGIAVCDRWRDSYEAFLADVGRRPSAAHSLHRVDNDGPYAPGNVVWALVAEQIANKRSTRLLTFGGVTQSIGAWATAVGVKPDTLGARLYRSGWSVERALTTPVRPQTKR